MASEELILSSLRKLKGAGLKGAPGEISVDMLEIWAEVFDAIPDETFAGLVVEYLKCEEFFPAPGSLYKLAEKRMEVNIELAWRRILQLCKIGIGRIKSVTLSAEEIATLDEDTKARLNGGDTLHILQTGFDLTHINDPLALWALSQLENVDTLGHREMPYKFLENKRFEFGRLYRAAFTRGYRLTRWDGKPVAIHERHEDQVKAMTEGRAPMLAQVNPLSESDLES